MVTHIARVWINRVRLPILLVVSWTGKKKKIPVHVRAWEFGLARQVRQSRPASACSSPYSGWIWCVLTGSLPSSAAASIYLFKTSIRHLLSPEFIGSRIFCTDGVHCLDFAGTGPVSLKVVPNECCLGRWAWTNKHASFVWCTAALMKLLLPIEILHVAVCQLQAAAFDIIHSNLQ